MLPIFQYPTMLCLMLLPSARQQLRSHIASIDAMPRDNGPGESLFLGAIRHSDVIGRSRHRFFTSDWILLGDKAGFAVVRLR